MRKTKTAMLDYAKLKADLERLSANANLSALAPILFIGIVFKFWLNALITFVGYNGFTTAGAGSQFYAPIPVQGLDFYTDIAASQGIAVTDTVLQGDISAALRMAHPEYIPDFLNFTFETNPVFGSILLVFTLCGYFIPIGYAVHSFIARPISPRLRKVLQILVCLGGLSWFAAILSTGVRVNAPVQTAKTIGFWLLHGALCVHLFTDAHTKIRRFLPGISVAVLFIMAGGYNLVDHGGLWGDREIIFANENQQLSAAALSGWWHEIDVFFKSALVSESKVFSNIAVAVFLIILFGYDFIKSRAKNINLFIRMGTICIWAASLAFLAVAVNGIFVATPMITITVQVYAFVAGIWFFNKLSSDEEQVKKTKEIIGNAIDKISNHPALRTTVVIDTEGGK